MKSLAKLLLTTDSAAAWTATGHNPSSFVPRPVTRCGAVAPTMKALPEGMMIDLEDPAVKAEWDLWAGKSMADFDEYLAQLSITPPKQYGEWELRQMVVACEMDRKAVPEKKEKYSSESARLFAENTAYRELVNKYNKGTSVNELNFVREYVNGKESQERILKGIPPNSPWRLRMIVEVEKALAYKEVLKTGKLKYSGWPNHFDLEGLKKVFSEYGTIEEMTIGPMELDAAVEGLVVFSKPEEAQAIIDEWDNVDFQGTFSRFEPIL